MVGFRTGQEEREAMGGTPGFQMETLEGSSLGSGGSWVKAAETQLTRTLQPQVTHTLSEQTALSPLEVPRRTRTEN